MKKRFLLLFVLLAGCATEQVEERNIVKEHPVFATEKHEKQPVYWEVQLEDTWNETTYPIVMNDFGYLIDSQFDEEAIETLASELAAQIDSPMIPAKLSEDGTLIPGKPRVILNEQKLKEQLQSLSIGTEKIEMPIEVTEPNIKEEEITSLDKNLIGQFTTRFNPHVTGRAHNIYLSAKEINNVILGPGDTFSFNLVVGERTKERGYKEAMEIVNKEFVLGIGGGICQTSSTLFNAVDEANLQMIERYTHSRNVGYVAPGRDATVSWGGPDFRFSNPHPFPIIIRSHVDLNSGSITISVYTNKEIEI